jgi:lysophospholipase L1-like esterase
MCTFTATVTTPPRLLVTRFAAFGDSITWGEDGTSFAGQSILPLDVRTLPRAQLPAAQTYPGALQADLTARYVVQTVTVANLGLSGEDVTGGGVARFSSVVVHSAYDVVLIMEGSNDLRDYGTSGEPSAIAGLQQMIHTAKGRGIRPFLATIPPMNLNGFRGGAANLVAGFDDRVRSLAASENVPLVDVYAALSTDIATYIGFDGLHPTPAGYKKIADTFFASIQQNLETSIGTMPTSVGLTKASGASAKAARSTAPALHSRR